jgi:hypothetical protein
MRLIIAFACAGSLVGSALAETDRHAGAHQHGHGKLDIAIEGATVSMALDVPASDIVGFEHAAKTEAERAKIADATAKLNNPLALFVLPKEAGCTLQEAKVKTENDPAGGHADFNAEYTLNCAAISKLSSIGFHYFKVFADAEALDVNVVSPNGQGKFEVDKHRPNHFLPGAK